MEKILRPIFHYTNYRDYLTDYYHWAKEHVRGFSHRAFLAKAGMSGPNYLKKVMEGHHNLTEASISKFVLALNLSGEAAEYFKCLVQFNQAKTLEDKDQFFEVLMNLKTPHQTESLDKQQYEYFKNWYNVAIREILAYFPYEKLGKELSQYIVPNISPKKVESSLALLEKLGLIEKTSEGGYTQTSKNIAASGDLRSLLLTKFHLSMAKLGVEAMERFKREERFYSSVTMSIDETTLEAFKEKIRVFRKELVEEVKKVPKSDRVYHLNLQLFPLSRTKPRQKRQRQANS